MQSRFILMTAATTSTSITPHHSRVAVGKPLAVQAMSLPAPTLALGDGITDAELKPVVDRFVAFTGVVSHERVVAVADAVITRFDELTPMVLT